MKKQGSLLSWTLAVSVSMFVGMKNVQRVLAETGSGRLTIQLTNVIDEPIVDYDKVVVPVAPAEGGTFTVPIICYCGPALVLGVEACGTNSLRVESSRDLVNWAPFPQPGFQLTLGINSTAVIPMTGTNEFFRAACDDAYERTSTAVPYAVRAATRSPHGAGTCATGSGVPAAEHRPNGRRGWLR